MFWKKKEEPKTPTNARDLAMLIKSQANAIVQDFFYPVEVEELTTLISLINYLDTFILKCLEGSRVTNKIWIGTVLLGVIKKLVKSKREPIREIVNNVAKLEYLIRENGESNGK